MLNVRSIIFNARHRFLDRLLNILLLPLHIYKITSNIKIHQTNNKLGEKVGFIEKELGVEAPQRRDPRKGGERDYASDLAFHVAALLAEAALPFPELLLWIELRLHL